ncbi:hypothetical protein NMY22_g9476 [Coprinellus aureogranulatus]|nr:hypothetical protein NMY22_g9476 [Coprinellus aureogranulatus]
MDAEVDVPANTGIEKVVRLLVRRADSDATTPDLEDFSGARTAEELASDLGEHMLRTTPSVHQLTNEAAAEGLLYLAVLSTDPKMFESGTVNVNNIRHSIQRGIEKVLTDVQAALCDNAQDGSLRTALLFVDGLSKLTHFRPMVQVAGHSIANKLLEWLISMSRWTEDSTLRLQLSLQFLEQCSLYTWLDFEHITSPNDLAMLCETLSNLGQLQSAFGLLYNLCDNGAYDTITSLYASDIVWWSLHRVGRKVDGPQGQDITIGSVQGGSVTVFYASHLHGSTHNNYPTNTYISNPLPPPPPQQQHTPASATQGMAGGSSLVDSNVVIAASDVRHTHPHNRFGQYQHHQQEVTGSTPAHGPSVYDSWSPNPVENMGMDSTNLASPPYPMDNLGQKQDIPTHKTMPQNPWAKNLQDGPEFQGLRSAYRDLVRIITVARVEHHQAVLQIRFKKMGYFTTMVSLFLVAQITFSALLFSRTLPIEAGQQRRVEATWTASIVLALSSVFFSFALVLSAFSFAQAISRSLETAHQILDMKARAYHWLTAGEGGKLSESKDSSLASLRSVQAFHTSVRGGIDEARRLDHLFREHLPDGSRFTVFLAYNVTAFLAAVILSAFATGSIIIWLPLTIILAWAIIYALILELKHRPGLLRKVMSHLSSRRPSRERHPTTIPPTPSSAELGEVQPEDSEVQTQAVDMPAVRPRLGDLDDAVLLGRDELALHSEGNPDRPQSLSSLANLLVERFKHAKELKDLEEAIHLQREALELYPEGHQNRSLYLNNLAIYLRQRYEASKDELALDEAIQLHRKALVLCPAGHPNRSQLLSDLALSLSERFDLAKGLEDLEEAIHLRREVLNLCPEGHPDRFQSLNCLAYELLKSFRADNDFGDLEESIQAYRKALEISTEGQPNRYLALCGIGRGLFERFRHKKNIEDLREAILSNSQAVACIPDGDDRREELQTDASAYAEALVAWSKENGEGRR